MTSLSTQIIRKLAGKDATIFNDCMKDGTRSYKVSGWTMADYEKAVVLLKEQGIYGWIVKARPYYAGRGGKVVQNIRLRV
jgi:biotin carboxylase